jgi:outer membrane protein OmpA-like peptidoglycan-associated protein
MTSSGNADLAARLTALEAEIRSLRASTDQAPSDPAATSPAASDAAPADTTSHRILNQLGEMQQALGRLETAREEAPAPSAAPAASPEPAEPAAPAGAGVSLETLDILLPLGEPRVFPEVQFESNRAALTMAGLQAVTSLARTLSAVPASRVSVVGHTDHYGDASYNRALSLERAKIVADVLFANGVSREQVTVEGRGEDAPIATNATAAGRQMNRRVEFLRTR